MHAKTFRSVMREIAQLAAEVRRLRAAVTALHLLAGFEHGGSADVAAAARQEIAAVIRDMQVHLERCARVITEAGVPGQALEEHVE
jgi:hypothetical protein